VGILARLMDVFQAIVLGIVQGLTEFLPVSSTAHLRIVPAMAGWEDPGAAFTAITQLGTMAAVLIYFRADLLRIARGWLAGLFDRERRGELESRLGWYIVLGTIPIGIFGLAFKDQIENGARDLYLIGTTLIVLGLVLLAAERVGERRRRIEDLQLRDGLAIGAGLFLGFDRESAARYSFLLSVPAVVLSGLAELASVLTDSSEHAPGLGLLAISTALAFVVGYISIAALLRFLTSHSTIVFVVYRVALGALVLVLVATGAIG
jgi:undecaprenyl-diphosphatase